MTNNITIKSGIDINKEEFKLYYNELKEMGVKGYYLDLAIDSNSQVLSNPIVFEEQDYNDYSVDDIGFIIKGNEIIGHMVYTLTKEQSTIPLSLGNKKHLDLERASQLSGKICFNKLEYFCKFNIDINDLIVQYLHNRIHGNLEYKGSISREDKIHIKK